MPYLVGFVYGLAFVVLHFSITDSYLDAKLGRAEKPKPVLMYGESATKVEESSSEPADSTAKKNEKVCAPNEK